MIRPALALLTAAALATVAVPADAAIVSYCTTHLVALGEGDSSSCVTPWMNADGLVIRTFNFAVNAGTVRATLTCGTSTESATVSGPYVGALEMIQWRFSSCTQSLTAVTAPASAVGVSTYYVTYV